MKTTYLKAILLGAAAMVSLTGCEDWLDVNPKSQIEVEDMFSRESGFQDELTGVYTTLCQSSLYGLQTSVGFAEVLSQSYDVDPASDIWRYAADYDYTNANVEGIINAIWLKYYNCISNINLVIEYAEKADKTMFTDNNYDNILGQAYGLRGFLHLELMKYFACAPAMDKSAKGVPYVTSYTTEVVAQKSVEETMQLIIADLQKSLEHFTVVNDALVAENDLYYGTHREKFNYYATVATLARAYMWMGDKKNALTYANIIIRGNDPVEGDELDYYYPFSWIHYSGLLSSNRNDHDVAFACEAIFYLQMNEWEDGANTYFHPESGSNYLSPTQEKMEDIYEINAALGNDYRRTYQYEADGSRRFLSKYWYEEGRMGNAQYPIIRMTECYYYAIECLRDTDPARATELLNAFRNNRGLSDHVFVETLTPEQIDEELYKEYRKEFIGDGGQLFFHYYKRLNKTDIKGSPKKGSKAVYVMPIPSTDAEFGGYTN